MFFSQLLNSCLGIIFIIWQAHLSSKYFVPTLGVVVLQKQRAQDNMTAALQDISISYSERSINLVKLQASTSNTAAEML